MRAGSWSYCLARRFGGPTAAIGVLVVAPIVEEAAKGVGATAGRPQTQSKTDGLVYGAAAGLGFSATENLVYALAALLVPGVGPRGRSSWSRSGPSRPRSSMRARPR